MRKIAFLEAMAAVLPIVASRAGAVSEIVPDQVAGFLEDPDDVQALAESKLSCESLKLATGWAQPDWNTSGNMIISRIVRRFLGACGLFA